MDALGANAEFTFTRTSRLNPSSVFVDVMIFRDIAGERERLDGYPLYASSLALIMAIVKRQIPSAFTSPLSLTGVAAEAKRKYMNKNKAEQFATTFIQKYITKHFTIVPLDEELITKALSETISEFEDRLIYYSAERCGASCVVTRNIPDLQIISKNRILVIEPEAIVGYPFWTRHR